MLIGEKRLEENEFEVKGEQICDLFCDGFFKLNYLDVFWVYRWQNSIKLCEEIELAIETRFFQFNEDEFESLDEVSVLEYASDEQQEFLDHNSFELIFNQAIKLYYSLLGDSAADGGIDFQFFEAERAAELRAENNRFCQAEP